MNLFSKLFSFKKNKNEVLTDEEPLDIIEPFQFIGEGSYIPDDFVALGRSNISIGKDTIIGMRNIIYTTRATVDIGNYVMTGPDVKIITGDHRIDVVGEYMIKITDSMKLPENDKPVVIEDDVWIGAGVIILKGVTIGRGSVISAGAVVRKNVPPYTIFYSHDNTRPRFNKQQIEEHEKIIAEKYNNS